MGETVESLYKSANILLLGIRAELERMEQSFSATVSGMDSAALSLDGSGALSASINELSRTVAQLGERVRAEGRGQLWRVRAAQLSEECAVLRKSIDAYMERVANAVRRRELLRTQRESEDTPAVLKQRESRLGCLAEEHSSLQNANSAADDIEAQADSILEGLGRQSELIGGIRQKVGSYVGLMGTNNKTVQALLKIGKEDKRLAIGILVGLIVVFYLLLYFFKR